MCPVIEFTHTHTHIKFPWHKHLNVVDQTEEVGRHNRSREGRTGDRNLNNGIFDVVPWMGKKVQSYKPLQSMLVYSHQQAFHPCSSVTGKYWILVRKHRKLLSWILAFSYCFPGICRSAVQTQQCNLPQLTQFRQFGTDKTWLEPRNGTLGTRISSFSPLGNCVHFCSSAAFYQSLQRAWKLFN